MTKLILSVKERLQFPGMLPHQGGLIEMELVKSIITKVNFTAEEIDEFSMRDLTNGSVQWDRKSAKDREFKFENSEIRIIKKGVELLDQCKEITIDNLDTVKRLLTLKEEEDPKNTSNNIK